MDSKSLRVVLLEKDKDMQTLILPEKCEGHFFFYSDQRNLNPIIQIIGIEGKWIGICLDKFYFAMGHEAVGKKLSLTDQAAINVYDGNKEFFLYVEAINDNRFIPYYIEQNNNILIGRNDNCDICYPNSRVSGEHAEIVWLNDNWHIEDKDSKNGVYLNGHRVKNREKLETGDIIFIMGLFIVMGVGFISMNNTDNRVRINNPKIRPVNSSTDVFFSKIKDDNKEDIFNRVIRSSTDLSAEEIEVEGPPMKMNGNKMPLLLRMGNQFLSGGRAIATGNVFSAMSSLMMPSLMQGFTEKERKEYEEHRKEVYEEYLRGKEDEINKEREREEKLLNKVYPSLQDTLGFADNKQRLWERRKYDDDFLTIRVGCGDVPMMAKLSYPKKQLEMEKDELLDDMYRMVNKSFFLHDVPVLLNLKQNYVMGISCQQSKKIDIINSIIIQIVSTHSYDEVKIIILADKTERKKLDYVRYLPHNWDNNKTIRFYCENVSDTQQLSKYLNKQLEDIEEFSKQHGNATKRFPAYVVVATNKNLYDNIECFKGIQESDEYAGFSIIAAFDGMPKECTQIITSHSNGVYSFRLDTLNDAKIQPLDFNLDKFQDSKKESSMREIMRTRLDIEGLKYSLPNMITFLEMFNAGTVEQLNPMKRWKDNNPVRSLAVPLGIGTDGEKFMLDLHEKHHGPHGLIAGGTGSGKSEFIITYILSMAVNFSPDEVAFILIDYKGGGLADAFVSEKKGIHLPHVVGTITNLDGAGISRSLMSINSELKRRQELFKKAKGETDEGTMDIYDYQKMYRNGKVSQPLPHLFIISDEFAELKKQQPEFMDELISTARIGRSLGVHLILATQKPSGVVNDQIWSNTKFRICLRVANKGDSMEMLKRPEAAEIRNTGRFYLQVGYNEIFAMGQSAWCGAEYIPQEEIVTEKDTSIYFLDNMGQTVIEEKPKKDVKQSEGKQINIIVKYLSDLAKSNGIKAEQLWCDPLPKQMDWDELKKSDTDEVNGISSLIGMLDDPEHQKQFLFKLDMLAFRSMFICGNSGSGKSSMLKTMLYSLVSDFSPEELNYYILDMSGGVLNAYSKLPHCGAYLTEQNEADFERLLRMIKDIVAKRKEIFAQAEVSTFEAYRNVGKMPLILFIIDGYTNINSFVNGPSIHASLYEYIREAGAYGVRFILTINHLNELHSKTRQEIDYRIALQAKDKYEYSDILDVRTNYTIPEIAGRGMCKYGDGVLEYHVAVTDAFEDEQERTKKLKSRLTEICNKYKEYTAAMALPMAEGNEKYEDFCSYFDKERFPLGYHLKDMKKVALPFQQMSCLSLYFGNSLGIKPVFSNFICAAERENMEIVVMKKTTDSVFDSYGNVVGIKPQNAKIMGTNSESLQELYKLIMSELVSRNVFRDEYCEKNNIPKTDKFRVQKAAKYLRQNTKPLLIIFESLADVCRLEKTEEIAGINEAFSTVFFKRLKGYNIYFIAGFYPSDNDVSNNSVVESYTGNQMAMLFGGCYDKQFIIKPASTELYSKNKVIHKYDHFYMKYRDALYGMRMPCGELVTMESDPDEISIV